MTTARVTGAGIGATPRPAKPGISHICCSTFGSASGLQANVVSRSVVWHAPHDFGDVALALLGVADEDVDGRRRFAAAHRKAVQERGEVAPSARRELERRHGAAPALQHRPDPLALIVVEDHRRAQQVRPAAVAAAQVGAVAEAAADAVQVPAALDGRRIARLARRILDDAESRHVWRRRRAGPCCATTPSERGQHDRDTRDTRLLRLTRRDYTLRCNGLHAGRRLETGDGDLEPTSAPARPAPRNGRGRTATEAHRFDPIDRHDLADHDPVVAALVDRVQLAAERGGAAVETRACSCQVIEHEWRRHSSFHPPAK